MSRPSSADGGRGGKGTVVGMKNPMVGRAVLVQTPSRSAASILFEACGELRDKFPPAGLSDNVLLSMVGSSRAPWAASQASGKALVAFARSRTAEVRRAVLSNPNLDAKAGRLALRAPCSLKNAKIAADHPNVELFIDAFSGDHLAVLCRDKQFASKLTGAFAAGLVVDPERMGLGRWVTCMAHAGRNAEVLAHLATVEDEAAFDQAARQLVALTTCIDGALLDMMSTRDWGDRNVDSVVRRSTHLRRCADMGVLEQFAQTPVGERLVHRVDYVGPASADTDVRWAKVLEGRLRELASMSTNSTGGLDHLPASIRRRCLAEHGNHPLWLYQTLPASELPSPGIDRGAAGAWRLRASDTDLADLVAGAEADPTHLREVLNSFALTGGDDELCGHQLRWLFEHAPAAVAPAVNVSSNEMRRLVPHLHGIALFETLDQHESRSVRVEAVERLDDATVLALHQRQDLPAEVRRALWDRTRSVKYPRFIVDLGQDAVDAIATAIDPDDQVCVNLATGQNGHQLLDSLIRLQLEPMLVCRFLNHLARNSALAPALLAEWGLELDGMLDGGIDVHAGLAATAARLVCGVDDASWEAFAALLVSDVSAGDALATVAALHEVDLDAAFTTPAVTVEAELR